MPLNLEFKAKINNVIEIKKTLKKIGAKYLETIEQTDTYYHTNNGRLKIREINNSITQLIHYQRDEQEEFRWSEYQIYDVNKVLVLKSILEKSLGVKGIICKRREVYIVNNCRIHLDDVDQLGNFLEFEYIWDKQEKDDIYNFIKQLKSLFSDNISQIYSGSYIDILLNQER